MHQSIPSNVSDEFEDKSAVLCPQMNETYQVPTATKRLSLELGEVCRTASPRSPSVIDTVATPGAEVAADAVVSGDESSVPAAPAPALRYEVATKTDAAKKPVQDWTPQVQ